MVFRGNDNQPRGARAFVQGQRLAAQRLALMCLMLPGLAACQSDPASGPEAWWHETVGGKINEQRPPPPGDKDPTPNLASVPKRPPPADSASWNRVTAALIADRIAANHAAALAPISTAGTAPPPVIQAQPAAANMTMTGVAPNSRAAGTPLPQPPSTPQPPNSPRTQPAASHLPPLPTREPPRPAIAPGPPPPPISATATPPPEKPRADGDFAIDFSAHSAALTEAALDRVKTLATGHGNRGIAVTGYGDAAISDPLGQASALDLALSRAQALATALAAQGVPSREVRVAAEAAGRGARLRLLR